MGTHPITPLEETAESRKRRLAKIILIVFLAWTAIGIMNTFQRIATTVDMRKEYPIWTLTRIAMGMHWLKAVLSLPVLAFVWKWPLTSGTWKRRMPLYFLVLIVYTVVYLVLRPFVVPALYYNSWTGVPLPQPPFLEGLLVAFRSFFFDIVYGFFLTVLAGYVWRYTDQLRETEIARERLQARLASAELQALKLQLQPHFLFNTLHTISNLAPVDSSKAQRMIARLSELLRLSLEHVSSEAVPLRRELQFLQNYLDIEKTRFEERLQIVMDIAPHVLDAEVPNMLLQPLVENAVRHGLSKKAEGGTIKISAWHSLGRMVIVIADDGRGITNGNKGMGIGLSNTRARLQQLYDHDFAFQVTPTPQGTTVRIEVPLRTATLTEPEEVGA
jgi:two-component system LytT family sensor kinase